MRTKFWGVTTLQKGHTFKDLTVVWNEGGITKINDILKEITQAPQQDGTLHSALATYDVYVPVVKYSASFRWKNYKLKGKDPWQVAWCLFDYIDDVHFSYVIVKSNGLEIGRVNGVRNEQQFIFTNEIAFDMTHTFTCDIYREGDDVRVAVQDFSIKSAFLNVNLVIPYKYKDGITSINTRVALYTEECLVKWTGLAVNDLYLT